MGYETATRRIVSHEWTGIAVNDSEYPADPVVQAQVDKWEAKVSNVVDVPIGRSTRQLSQAEIKGLMEAAMSQRFPSDLAYMNVSGVRDTLPEGQLLARHVWNVMPFDDYVVTLEVPGDQLMKLEDSSRPVKVAGDAKLDPQRIYRLATVDFLASGWADRGYKFKVTEQGALERDVLIDWIKQRKVIP